jgi:uncharacterized protein (TIGR04255 family)
MSTSLYPVSGRHAVQSASLKLNLKPSSGVVKSISRDVGETVHAKLIKLFPEIGAIKSIVIQVGPGGTSAPANEANAGWKFFLRASPEAVIQGLPVVRSLQLQQNDLTFTEMKYQRWADFRDVAVEALAASLEEFAKGNEPLDGITLQYVDAFLWKGYKNDFTPATVFDTESPFLPRNVFALGDQYWHVNQGFFNGDSDPNTVMLDNINIGRAANKQQNCDWFTITTSHKISPTTEVRGSKDIRKFFDGVIEGLHTRNKFILKNLLNLETQELIELNGKSV